MPRFRTRSNRALKRSIRYNNAIVRDEITGTNVQFRRFSKYEVEFESFDQSSDFAVLGGYSMNKKGVVVEYDVYIGLGRTVIGGIETGNYISFLFELSGLSNAFASHASSMDDFFNNDSYGVSLFSEAVISGYAQDLVDYMDRFGGMNPGNPFSTAAAVRGGIVLFRLNTNQERTKKNQLVVASYDKTKAPFKWIATADSNLEKIQCLCSQISGTGH